METLEEYLLRVIDIGPWRNRVQIISAAERDGRPESFDEISALLDSLEKRGLIRARILKEYILDRAAA